MSMWYQYFLKGGPSEFYFFAFLTSKSCYTSILHSNDLWKVLRGGGQSEFYFFAFMTSKWRYTSILHLNGPWKVLKWALAYSLSKWYTIFFTFFHFGRIIPKSKKKIPKSQNWKFCFYSSQSMCFLNSLKKWGV